MLLSRCLKFTFIVKRTWCLLILVTLLLHVKAEKIINGYGYGSYSTSSLCSGGVVGTFGFNLGICQIEDDGSSYYQCDTETDALEVVFFNTNDCTGLTNTVSVFGKDSCEQIISAGPYFGSIKCTSSSNPWASQGEIVFREYSSSDKCLDADIQNVETYVTWYEGSCIPFSSGISISYDNCGESQYTVKQYEDSTCSDFQFESIVPVDQCEEEIDNVDFTSTYDYYQCIPKDSDGGLTAGAIAGIVVGVIVFVLFVAAFSFFILRKGNSHQQVHVIQTRQTAEP